MNLKGKKDEARSVVPNIGRKIIKTFKIYFEGNEVLSISNYDEIKTYLDFWLAKKDKARRVFQGIDDADALKVESRKQRSNWGCWENSRGQDVR